MHVALPSSLVQRIIGIVVHDDALLLNVSGPAEVFATANRECRRVKHRAVASGVDFYRSVVFSTRGGSVRMSCGLEITSAPLPHPDLAAIDTLLVVGGRGVESAAADPSLRVWLRAISSRVRRIATIGNGVQILASAGLMQHRHCVTHWMYAKQMQLDHPDVQVDGTALFDRDGNVFSSAGASAGIDLALQLVEDDLGRAIAHGVARSMVLPIKRAANQRQISPQLQGQGAASSRIASIAAWIDEHYAKPLATEKLTSMAAMSERNFARRFRAETGMSAHVYVERVRIAAARQLMSDSDLPLDKIALRVGLHDAQRMRRALLRAEPSPYLEPTTNV